MNESLEPQAAIAELASLKAEAKVYFRRVAKAVGTQPKYYDGANFFWGQISIGAQKRAEMLTDRTVRLAGRISDLARKAPLVSEADEAALALATKAMRAALHLRRYSYWETEVLHDEGRVLGVRRAGHSEDEPAEPAVAQRTFLDGADQMRSLLDLVAASRELEAKNDGSLPSQTRYRPGTSFIMMSMADQPDLEDVADAVKSVFSAFDIKAVRADDIEHQGLITARILSEIETAEFLFADLTGERPNVYYEVGYAHALQKRPILFRKDATHLHFDLAGFNCPSYKNLHDLRLKLTSRLEALTNREPKGDQQKPKFKPAPSGADTLKKGKVAKLTKKHLGRGASSRS